jgi:hypothetical protein
MTNTERHTKTEVELRAKECYKLRYETSPSITQEKWHCHKIYGDRSEIQYCAYWSKAKDMYQEGWKERLDKLLGPAVDELTRSLASEDEKIRQRAIDQVFDYTGHKIKKVEAEVKGDVIVTFGNQE